MKNLILIFVIIFIFSSCMTQEKLNKICSTCPVKIVTKDSVHTEIKYKDSTVYITQQGPTVYLPHPCANICDSLGHLKKTFVPIIKKEKGIVATVQIRNDSLIFNCKDDSLKKVIVGLNQRITEFHDHEEVKTLPPVVTNVLTKLQGFWIVSGWLFWIIVICYAGIKAWKYYKQVKKIIP